MLRAQLRTRPQRAEQAVPGAGPSDRSSPPSSGVRLRALTDGGVVLEDPSDAELLGLLEDIDAGEGTALVVERADDPTGQTYVQVLRTEAEPGWEVEHRAGSPDKHFRTVVGDVESAHHLVAGWALERPDWLRSVMWTRVEFNP